MKNVWTKVGIFSLAGVIIANAFIPYATALDIAPEGVSETATAEVPKMAEHFTLESSSLDFGRATELGRSYTKEIAIKNATSNDVVIDASVRKNDKATEASAKMADWVVFVGGINHFSVAAGGSRNLSVRVLVPEDAASGSQYTFIDLTDADGYTETVSAKIDIAGDNLKYNSSVDGAWIDPVRVDDILNGSVTVKNTGTAGFVSKYQIKAKNIFDGSDWVIIKEVSEDVYPGSEAKFTVSDKLGFGIYSIEQRVTSVNADGKEIESLVSRTVINLPWWALAIAGGVIVLLIIVIVCAKRRKKSKRNDEKIKRAEKKARKADIERIERAEKAAIVDKKEQDAKAKEAADEEKDEIEEIAEALDDAEQDELADDDAEFDEEEAVPIKVTIKKKK
jgi:hypothetical protein